MVKMTAVIDARLSGMNWENFKESDNGITFGGYRFNVKVNGEQQSVNFDWDSFSGDVQNSGFLLLETGVSTFFGPGGGISEEYEEEYEEEGFSISDLTAKVLANAKEIEEFCVDYDNVLPGDYIRLVSVSFEDENGNTYDVAQEVLDDFNYAAVEEYAMNGFHLGDCDLEGLEVTEDDIQAIHTRVSSCPHLSIPAVTLSYFKEVREIMNYDLEIEE